MMLDVLRDPIWQFIGATIGIIAIVVSIYLFRRQTSRKSLACEVLLDTAMLTVSEGIEGRIRILFDDNLIRNLYMTVVRISNNGDVPIITSDFIEPLRIQFDKNNEVYGAAVVETKPKELRPRLQHDRQVLNIEPLLLNSGDSITVRILLSRSGRRLHLQTRIVGVSSISRASTINRYLIMVLAGSLLMMTAGIVMILIGVASSTPEDTARQWSRIQTMLPWLSIPIVMVPVGLGLIAYASYRLWTAYTTINAYAKKSEEWEVRDEVPIS